MTKLQTHLLAAILTMVALFFSELSRSGNRTDWGVDEDLEAMP